MDCETRCNSTWDLIDVLLQMNAAVYELLRRIQLYIPRYDRLNILPANSIACGFNDMLWSTISDFYSFLCHLEEVIVLL